MKILSGPASPFLGKKIADVLKAEIAQAEFKRFPDGELYVRAESSDVVVQSICSNDDLVYLILMLSAIENSEKIAVIPYFGYARQDRKFQDGEAVSIREIARIVESYTDKIISVNLHSEIAKRYFKNLVEIDAMPMIGGMYRDKDVVMISPDKGSLERVKVSAEAANCDYDYLEKRRISATEVEISPKNIDVEGRDVVIVDDIISTGGTIVEATRILRNMGAKSVSAVCVHAVMSNFALNKLYSAGVKEVIATDTIERIVSRISVSEPIASEIKNLI
ncbi:ribose-phosphate pyrophosphokinase [Archaeoglobus sulfaticallidus PM70-1]|uniref:Ribose-phosphate pyrophosphokinase n=1 Tax=Archaeoglobus sulfaticallidus PM70-1 TaxID=387631 RepID=N0BAW7_9EURY|nr:ribose-phosphate diphosphokinase [Archaeoglobus sulfaticallidus]AGK60749.1 ribose-phosphate pyrophosphokinase [Archaeoglobus sulfaticallidus PM70-1]